MRKKSVDVAVIIPDASPIMTLADIGRLDLLSTFSVPIRIVDQVHYEVTKPENDPEGTIAQWLRRLGNQIEIVETTVGLGFKVRLERGENPKRTNLGELAISEYAHVLATTSGPSFVPLVLFEDPDVLDLPIATLKQVHLLNTTGWLRTLQKQGIVADAGALIERVNARRKTPMDPIDRPARTRKLRSTWLRRSRHDAS